ncbi:MAG TPA: HupE/UreJ family protein [Alphaproteobacteria bacterium]|jgi:urease accessory protein|nr:HupE/UreJ family protein [Alphaproteobacteria bacterium]
MRKLALFATLALAIGIKAAAAHTFGAWGAGPAEGFLHPLGGLDHMLAMIAVGMWATQQGGRAQWALPVAFVLAMVGGAALALSGIILPGIESGILASVLVLGLAISWGARLPLWAPIAVVVAFAVFHGHAHGLELPEAASPAGYAAGFVVATAALHVVGIGLALGLRRLWGAVAVRSAGAAVLLGGLALVAG